MHILAIFRFHMCTDVVATMFWCSALFIFVHNDRVTLSHHKCGIDMLAVDWVWRSRLETGNDPYEEADEEAHCHGVGKEPL
jgi:hypothetical protein